jgi:single-strand DNA-binding protein
MSRCLNKATLIGYLGADPEIRTIPSGARVAQFSLGTTRRWNDRDGKLREKTQWHRVQVWDSLPATFGFVEKYLRKGDRVYVEGEIDYRSYETDSGDTRWTTEIKASEILGAGALRKGAVPRVGPAELRVGSVVAHRYSANWSSASASTAALLRVLRPSRRSSPPVNSPAPKISDALISVVQRVSPLSVS